MKNILFILFSFGLAAEMEVDGNLKVTGTVDASGNPITNVGTPLLSTDAANADYVLTATAGKGRIITLKCPWFDLGNTTSSLTTSTCEPPQCPDGWSELATFSETTGVGGHNLAGNGSSTAWMCITGNSVRYCMEQETE